MRSMRIGALAVLALCTVAAFGRPAVADPNDGGTQNQTQSQSMRHGKWEKQFVRFSKKLNLTEEQREQIRPIFADQAEQAMAISHDKTLSKMDRGEKLHAIRSATEEKIEPLLTPDQMEKWGEWKQKNWDREQNRRQNASNGDNDRNKWHTHRRSGTEATWRERFEQFSQTLSLTEDQQEKIRPIFEDQAEQLKAVYNDQSLSPEDRQEKVKSIHSATEEKIEPFLTQDQMEKWGEWKQKGWDRAEEQNQQSQQNQQNGAPTPDPDQKTDSDSK